MSTIQLPMCLSITVYKGQGVTVGTGVGEVFERIVVHIPAVNSKVSVTGQELLLLQFLRANRFEISCNL